MNKAKKRKKTDKKTALNMLDNHAKEHALTPEMEKVKWKKGQSGNPKGRPPMEKCFSDTARLILNATELNIDLIVETNGKKRVNKIAYKAKRGFYHALVCALLKEGMSGNVQAIKELIDRSDGKVKEMIETHQTQVLEIIGGKYEPDDFQL